MSIASLVTRLIHLVTSEFIIPDAWSSFPGIVDDDIKTVSPFLRVTCACSPLDILASAENSSPCAPVHKMSTLSSGIFSISLLILRIVHFGTLIYPSCSQISTLLIMDLPERKTILLCLIAELMS